MDLANHNKNVVDIGMSPAWSLLGMHPGRRDIKTSLFIAKTTFQKGVPILMQDCSFNFTVNFALL